MTVDSFLRCRVIRLWAGSCRHRDRFCWFGSYYVQATLAAQYHELIVVGSSKVGDDRVQDTTEILNQYVCSVVRQPCYPEPR